MPSHARKPERLTAKLKFEIYLKTRESGAPVAEVLRHHGLHLDDLIDDCRSAAPRTSVPRLGS